MLSDDEKKFIDGNWKAIVGETRFRFSFPS